MVADMRRGGPEPASGMPEIRRTPGMADEMLKELGPLLAEEGIDLGGSGVQDMVTLQAALDRAVERRNMQLFTPVGEAREQATHALRRVVTAISAGDSVLAADILDGVPPESPVARRDGVGVYRRRVSAWWITAGPATTTRYPLGWVSRCVCPPGTGSGSGPLPPFSPCLEKVARFAR